MTNLHHSWSVVKVANAADEVTTIDVVNLVIAILAFVGAVVALVWRFVEWRLTGSVVKVVTKHAVAVTAGVGDPRAVTVTAHNVGRTQVAVTGWGFRVPDHVDVVDVYGNVSNGPAVPLTLLPGHEAAWVMLRHGLAKALATYPADTPIRGFVHLGTGRTILAKDPVTLSE